MPIISNVGRKAASVRLLTCLLYLLLIVGGVTMLYPFLLMISTSLTDQVDYDEYRLIPRYFHDEEAKFAKFISAKYSRTDAYRALHPADINTFRQVGMPTYLGDPNPATSPRIDVRTGQETPPRVRIDATWEQLKERVRVWRAFQMTLPPITFATRHLGIRNTPGKTEVLWRKHLQGIYGSVAELNTDLNKDLAAFTETFAPYEKPDGRLWPGVEGDEGRVWDAFKKTLDPRYRVPVDGTVLWQKRLRYMLHKIDDANEAFGTAYDDFRDIPLPVRLPDTDALALEWYQLVRSELPYRFVHLDDGGRKYREYLTNEFGTIARINEKLHAKYASPQDIKWPPERPAKRELDQISIFLHGINEDLNYRAFIKETHGDIKTVNKAFGTKYHSIETLPWPPLAPRKGAELKTIGVFLHTRSHIRHAEVRTPDKDYTRFLAAEYGAIEDLNTAFGSPYKSFDDVRPPYDEEDLWEFREDRKEWMQWFLTRNYIDVVDYIAIRGRALWNTVILLSAMIFCALTVNPLAAYALSRFRLGYTNSVLLFVLATMAFPYEVAMIPNFLLLRRFPLWTWLVGLVVGGIVAFIVLRRTTGQRKWVAIPIGFGAAVVAGLYLTPLIGKHIFGIEAVGNVSLLNTFAALILPRMANGYAIFLLKGFFDSLPEELFEAGKIDGASELRMFWQVAFPLSKPIFAVMALQTFTAIYGSYIWALVVCQSDKMWTLMVYIFQLQQFAPQYVTMAATVLASIPTLLVFIFAQKTIMRGIIIPAYK